MSSDEDEGSFLDEMGDVKPLNIDKKVNVSRKTGSEDNQRARRQSAVEDQSSDSNHLSSDYRELLDPYYPLEFKRSGVQNGVFRKLKQGKYPREAVLDLHRMTVDKARKEVFDFIKESASYDLRSLIIVHGKGQHSDSKASILKSCVNSWLPDMEEVLAFSSAQPQHGGLGAVYVMLAKSENKKLENRTRINRGRINPDE